MYHVSWLENEDGEEEIRLPVIDIPSENATSLDPNRQCGFAKKLMEAISRFASGDRKAREKALKLVHALWARNMECLKH